MIFDKDTIWDEKPIVYSDNDIKELDEAIVYIEISKSETKKIEDIQLIENAKVDKPTPTVTRQTDHEDKDLDENLEELE